VIQVIECLGETLPVDQRALKAGLLGAKLSGRFEIHQRRCRWVLDVAHNPQSAAQLAAQLGDLFVAGTRHAVVGMLRDKPMAEVLALLAGRVDRWHLLDLSHEARGASAEQLRQALPAAARQQAECCGDIDDCLRHLDRQTDSDDLVLVFGSFHTVGPVLEWLQGPANAPG
jgi:dihydrofolate synthase / folylpolyglutamate synthase